MTRLIIREVQAIRQRVGRGSDGLAKWLEMWYEKFWAVAAEQMVVGCNGLAKDARRLAGEIAAQHISESHSQLAEEFQKQPDDIGEAIRSRVANWTHRKINWTACLAAVANSEECSP